MNAQDLVADANPFPLTAVADDPRQRLPNYTTLSQVAALKGVQRFADRFASGQTGSSFGIRGGIGSGKTHTLFQLRDKLRELLPSTKFVYAKTLDARTLLDFYGRVFPGGLDLDDFRNALSLHYLKLLRKRAGPIDEAVSDAGTLDTAALREALARLRTGDRQFVLELVEAELIPTAVLKQRRESEVLGGDNLLLRDLAFAYSKIAEERHAASAVKWLQGRELSEQEMSDLGVTSRIATIGGAHQALSFLLYAFRQAQLPLMLVVDEIERTVLKDGGEPDAAGRNLLKDVAEVLKTQGHLVGFCGLGLAWDSLSEDFFGRVARDDIVEARLQDVEGEEVVRAWEKGSGTVFSANALSLAVEAAEFNPRRLLEIAHHSWELRSEAKAAKVLPEHVRAAARKALGDSERRKTAVAAIASAAGRNGLELGRSPVDGYDFALGPVGAPRVFVKVTASVFKDDEVENIRRLVQARHAVLREHPSARTCTVIAGYSSPAIVDELQRGGDFVIRFVSTTFDEAIDGLLRARPKEGPPAPAGLDDAHLVEVNRKLDAFAADSKAQIDGLQKTFDSLQQQRVQRLDAGFAKNSADKLAEAIDAITAYLGDEGEARRTKEGKGVPEILQAQQTQVQYAIFLDRVVPTSHLASHLTSLERLIQQSLSGGGNTYESRLEVLRAIREATGSRSVAQWIRSSAGWRSIAAALGAVSVLAYATVLVRSYAIESPLRDEYQAQLERLSSFAVRYRGWPRDQVPADEFRVLLNGLNQGRTAFNTSSFGRRSAIDRSALDDALSKAGTAILCRGDSCPGQSDSSTSLGDLGEQVEKELRNLPEGTMAAFLPRYLPASAIWLFAALTLMLPAVIRAWLRSRRRFP